MRETLLEVTQLTKFFDGIQALNGVSFSLEKGCILGIVGPNGSGKTTLFNTIGGYLRPTRGGVKFAGEQIDSLAPYKVARAGIGRTFQTVRVYHDMTLMENMFVSSIVHQIPDRERRALELLHFVGLHQFRNRRASALSYGQQRLLEFATRLMTDPKLMMLDEPIAGVNPVLIERLADLIRTMRERGVTFLLVEHNIRFVTMLCDRVLVLDHGIKIAEGRPSDIQANAMVIEAYLGKGIDASRG